MTTFPDLPTFVTHLECAMTGEKLRADVPHNLSPAGFPILVRYDLAGVREALTKEKLADRARDWWRYRELLPVRKAQDIVSLGEVMTPLIPMPRFASSLGVSGEVMIKDEGRLPTGSFKARGLALAVCMAKEFGIKKMAMPTNGNAGAALAAYASRAGIETVVFCPDDTPVVNVNEIAECGARVYKVNGLINDCGKLVGAGVAEAGWFDTSTLKEPYRIEGKKTMGLELAEQLNWQLPDAILYPTGGGTGLIGMWKAFDEMERMGWIDGRRPRMVSVQAEGCAPIVRAFHAGATSGIDVENPQTIAAGLRVPRAVGDFIMLDILRKSGGAAVAVPDQELLRAVGEIGEAEGVFAAPEGAATLPALRTLLTNGQIGRDERVVLFNTGSGLKYLDAFR